MKIAEFFSARSVFRAAIPALLYMLLCIAYIIISGRNAASSAVTVDQLARIESIKGIAFVIVTGFMIFVILLVYTQSIRKGESEREQAHAALRESEQRLLAVFNAVEGVPIQAYDKERRVIFWNPASEVLYGYSREEAIGRALEELIIPEASREAVVEGIRQWHDRGIPIPAGEVELINKSGERLQVYSNHVMITNHDGEKEMFCIDVDLTERKRAEEVLRESEKRFNTAFQYSPAPLVLSEIDTGRFIDVNERWVEMLEFTREEQIGATSKQIGIWDNPEERDRIVAILHSRGRFRDEPIRFKTRSGKTIQALWSAETVDLSGKQTMLSMITDITQLRQAEEGLLRQQRSLDLFNRIAAVFLTASRDDVYSDVLEVILKGLDSRFGFFGIINEAGDLVCPSMTRDVWDKYQVPEKSIVFPRATWGGLWGRSLMEKRTLVSNENLSLPEGHVTLENALATPIMHGDTLIGQFVVANKAGGYDQADRALLEAVAAYTAPILFAIQEEARQKAAHANLETQLRQAQKMESVGRLAGGVAHDFNNMLNVILGHTEIMFEDLPPKSPARDGLDEIRKAAERSANLTRQLLAFARKQTIAPESLDLNDAIATMLKMLQRLIGEDIDLLWKPGAPLDTVHIDPGQVDQILANLAVNARDAIGHDHGKVTIETGNAHFDEAYCADHAGFVPGDYVMLAISDDGCGMDEATRANIFEPFFTTKGVGEGTGLGLATVYGIVKQNDGFVNVYSEPGQGTTFKIFLPALAEGSARPAEAEADPDSMENGHGTILVVEDQRALLNLTRTMLTRRGYTVLAASSPGEALRLAREQSGGIDLLITDVVMPEMNGRELAEQLQALCPGLKSLFMSGYTANVIAHQGVLEEGVNFIQKPFSQNDLSRMVRRVLDA